MITYDLIPLSRSDKAHWIHNDRAAAEGRKYAKHINDTQWAMVARGEADMDAAFVLAVEAEEKARAKQPPTQAD